MGCMGKMHSRLNSHSVVMECLVSAGVLYIQWLYLARAVTTFKPHLDFMGLQWKATPNLCGWSMDGSEEYVGFSSLRA